MLYEIARFLQVPAARFFDGLRAPGAGDAHEVAAEIDKRIAYTSTTDGRQLIEGMLRLSPRIRSRVIAIVGILAEEEEQPERPLSAGAREAAVELPMTSSANLLMTSRQPDKTSDCFRLSLNFE